MYIKFKPRFPSLTLIDNMLRNNEVLSEEE